MKSALLYVFLIWITTVIVPPIIYFYVFDNPGWVLFAGGTPDRQIALMITYPITLLFTLPGAAILVFATAIINRELENPPLKKLLVALSGIFLILISRFIHLEDIRNGWDSTAIYCGVLILSCLVYPLKPE